MPFTGALWCPVFLLLLFVGYVTVYAAFTPTCSAEEGVSEGGGFPMLAPLFTYSTTK